MSGDFVSESSHPLADRKRVQLADLTGEDLIQFPTGWGIRQRLDAAFTTIGAQAVSGYEVADYAIAAQLIRHRLATALCDLT